ncbi:hypothetical protein DL89DRAFT_280333 [Linderina pennispora]|uniref:Uncharacterized protein n=1 Tax=Linderina pennispora TaxID=61395 RepID=A0A1Y1WKQ7_9FUNG|nr:uncharacterized protein DL89DRAFT_280333 [Linderina pennispora]ORX73786.1 hypothetical protein DL89DRAFT_280333 [Linderina pennispora]
MDDYCHREMIDCCERPLTCELKGQMSAGDIMRVKKLELHWNISGIIDGTANLMFMNPPLNQVFPNMIILVISFDDWDRKLASTKFNETLHAEKFCSEIRRMLPNMRSIMLSDCSASTDLPCSSFIRALLSGLCSQAASIDFREPWQPNLNIIPFSRTDIRSLSLNILSTDSPAIEMIHRNAPSLEYIGISSDSHKVFTKTICSDDNTPIVYPRVRSLQISFSSYLVPGGSIFLDSPDGAPFPALEKLECEQVYPFSNDILFKGNSKSLASLKLDLDTRSVSVLNRHSVFSASRFPVLEYLNTRISLGDADVTLNEDTRSVLLLGAKAQIIKSVSAYCDFDQLGISIDSFGHNITILDIPTIRFTLRWTVQLIKVLPFLRRMATGIEITDGLRSADQTHSRCIGKCRHSWGLDDLSSGGTEGPVDTETDDGLENTSDIGSGNSRDSYDRYYNGGCSCNDLLCEFLFDHLDIVYSEMDFMDEIYTECYPLSTTLTILNKAYDDSEPIASSKMVAILIVLCPSIQRVQTNWLEDKRSGCSMFTPDTFIARADVEETRHHANLMHHLERAGSGTL